MRLTIAALLLTGLSACSSLPSADEYAAMSCNQLAEREREAERTITRKNWGTLGKTAVIIGTPFAIVSGGLSVLPGLAIGGGATLVPTNTEVNHSDLTVSKTTQIAKGCYESRQAKIILDRPR